jgi:hypothetical protein
VLKAQEARAAETWLERRLAEHGPFRTQEAGRLSGGAGGFQFECGAVAACRVDVVEAAAGRRLRVFKGAGEAELFRLPNAEAARFVYRGGGDVGPSWPPAGADRQALQSITLLQGEGANARVVLAARIRTEQPIDCQFDAVMQDCR